MTRAQTAIPSRTRRSASSTRLAALRRPSPRPRPTPHSDEISGAPQADGFTTFVVAARNKAPIVLRTLTKNVKALANGFSVAGDLTLQTPLGPMTLANGSLVLEWAPDHNDGIKPLRGDVDVSFPKLGALSDFVDPPVHASIGEDLGAKITATDLPINADRPYLFFDVGAGFSAAAGPISFAAPGGKAGRLYIDPTDPSVYVDGNLFGLGDIGQFSDMGVGLWARGLIPFTPVSTWGIETKVGNLKGHVYAKGTYTLARYPISIDGELFANVDPDGDGRSIFNGQSSEYEMGANGTLNISADFLQFFTFKFPVAKATLGARLTAAEKYVDFSGVADPDDKWLPTVLPLRLGGRVKVAGLIHGDVVQSYVKAEGEYLLETTMMNDLLDLGLQDITLASATMNVDKTGFRVTGKATTPFASQLKSKGQLTADAFFADRPDTWYVKLNGHVEVLRILLAAAESRLSPQGLFAHGAFKTPISSVDLDGQITKTGATLSGSLTFHVTAPNHVLQRVTDAAVCGYKTVKDAGVCGVRTVTDGAQCGTRVVQDAAKCGTQAVTDAAQCGTRAATDAAVCGTRTVTDGAVCGFNTVSSWFCDNFGGPACSTAKSCSVAASCNVAKTCNIVVLSATSSGVSGALHSSMCTGGNCVALPGGRVVLGASPKACVSGLTGLNGEACTPFWSAPRLRTTTSGEGQALSPDVGARGARARRRGGRGAPATPEGPGRRCSLRCCCPGAGRPRRRSERREPPRGRAFATGCRPCDPRRARSRR